MLYCQQPQALPEARGRIVQGQVSSSANEVLMKQEWWVPGAKTWSSVLPRPGEETDGVTVQVPVSHSAEPPGGLGVCLLCTPHLWQCRAVAMNLCSDTGEPWTHSSSWP